MVPIIVGDETENSVSLIIIGFFLIILSYNTTIGPIYFACIVEVINNFGMSLGNYLVLFFTLVISLVFPFML